MSILGIRDLRYGALLIFGVLLAGRELAGLFSSNEVEWLFVLAGAGLGVFLGVMTFFVAIVNRRPAITLATLVLVGLLFFSIMLWKTDVYIGFLIFAILLVVSNWSRAIRSG